MKTSEQLNELATALSKAQGEISDAEKSSDNPFFKSKYADLAEVLGQIRPIFSANGLSIIQLPSLEAEGHVAVNTMLLHSSGQWVQDAMSMPVQGKNVAQESGSVITYMRRYAAAAVAGIAQVDTDANQAAKKGEALSEVAPKEWYNTVEEDKDAIIGAIMGGKTGEEVITGLRDRYKLSKKTEARIMEFASA